MPEVWMLPEKVTFHVEESGQELFGTLRDYSSAEKCYTNDDLTRILSHVLDDSLLATFFPNNLAPDLKKDLQARCEILLSELCARKFLKKGEAHQTHGLMKQVRTKPPLRVLFIETTKACNLRCVHCYVADCQSRSTKQLSFRILQTLIAEADHLGIMEIQLTGGEFFLIQKSVELLADLQRRLIPCSIFTNGTVVPGTLWEHLRQDSSGLIFYVSLDGPREIHDVFRGVRGSFDKTVKFIENLLGLGCDVRINTSVGSHNITHLKDFLKEVKDRFGVLHRLVTIEPIGRAENHNELQIDEGEIRKAIREDLPDFQFLDSHDSHSASDWHTPACGVGTAMMFVDAYGNASLCPTMTQEQNSAFLAGNILTTPLQEIWEHSPVFNRFRHMQCQEIERCEFRAQCHGGCRSKAYLDTRDVNAPDTTMCSLYGKRV